MAKPKHRPFGWFCFFLLLLAPVVSTPAISIGESTPKPKWKEPTPIWNNIDSIFSELEKKIQESEQELATLTGHLKEAQRALEKSETALQESDNLLKLSETALENLRTSMAIERTEAEATLEAAKEKITTFRFLFYVSTGIALIELILLILPH